MEDKISRKNILYGVGVRGEKCYWLYHSQYHFEFCIDRIGKGEFHGLNVYSFEEKAEDLTDCFLIIAVDDKAYKDIRKNLEDRGLVEFQDFIFGINL